MGVDSAKMGHDLLPKAESAMLERGKNPVTIEPLSKLDQVGGVPFETQ